MVMHALLEIRIQSIQRKRYDYASCYATHAVQYFLVQRIIFENHLLRCAT